MILNPTRLCGRLLQRWSPTFRSLTLSRKRQILEVKSPPKSSSRWKKTFFMLSLSGGVIATGTVMLSMPMKGFYKFSLPNYDESQFPTRYDALAIKEFWDKRPLHVISRAQEVVFYMGPFLTKLVLWEMLIRRKILTHEGLQQKYAAELRVILTKLGPCFIKFGQALSIRPDILPSPVLFELQKLCDAVPSIPTEIAIEVMKSELKMDPALLFEDFGPRTQPIAAASLGQVYKLKIRESGEVVAVKVQRPDILVYILRDLYIMRRFAQIVECFKELFTHHRPYDVALLDMFAKASLLELDYLNEASNQERFRKDLMPKLKGQVYIPKVYEELTTRKVLVSEWVEGVQLAKSPPDVINELTRIGVECFLTQLLETGYFHADPHPGNLLVTQDGTLALIDFGLCSDVPLPDTTTLTMAIVHLMQGDIAGLIKDAIKLGFLPEDVDIGMLQVEIQRVYDNAQVALNRKDQRDVINASKFKAVVRRRKRFMAVSFDLNKIFFKYPFFVPEYFALITRAMIVLEGIAVSGNPEFDLFASAYPYAVRRAVSLFGVANLSQIVKEAAQSGISLV